MLFYRFDYLTIILFIAFCVPETQSDLQISPKDIEYAVSRIANRQKALQFKSQPYFKNPINTNLNREQKKLLNDAENGPPQEEEEEQEIHDGENEGENRNNPQPSKQRQQKKYNFKKVDAAQSTILSKQHEIEPQDVRNKKREPQDQQEQQEEKDVEVKPIIQNGVNQPHNHQNHQHLTVNQTEQKQQLSQHRFKLLNVVKPRNIRQTPTVNSIYNNNNNNNVDANQQQQQQYSSKTIQYYPTNQLQKNQQQHQQQQEQQEQYQQPQQYQLQYYQPSQTQTQTQNEIRNQNLQNYNNIALIVNGNSLSTFPQTTARINIQQYQQQQPNQIPIIITQPTNVITSTPKPVPSAIPILTTSKATSLPFPSLAATSSSISSSSTNGNSLKPFLPLELIKDFSGGGTTSASPTICNLCCTPNALPCSQCCDGNPLLNAQTLKALGG